MLIMEVAQRTIKLATTGWMNVQSVKQIGLETDFIAFLIKKPIALLETHMVKAVPWNIPEQNICEYF